MIRGVHVCTPSAGLTEREIGASDTESQQRSGREKKGTGVVMTRYTLHRQADWPLAQPNSLDRGLWAQSGQISAEEPNRRPRAASESSAGRRYSILLAPRQ